MACFRPKFAFFTFIVKQLPVGNENALFVCQLAALLHIPDAQTNNFVNPGRVYGHCPTYAVMFRKIRGKSE